MAGSDVVSLLDDDTSLVRKHGTQLLALADYSEAVPTTFFDAVSYLPSALPAGFKNLGYITTAGIVESTKVTASDVQMVQDILPVRSDITAIGRTLHVVFGESNAWTQAVRSGKPVSAFAATKDAAYKIDDGEIADYPYYRAYVITQDGVGTDARYRVEFGYKAKVTDMGDRTLSRTDVESIDVTLTLFRDPGTGLAYTKVDEGPGYPTHLGA